jgi:hypothetical protein
MICPKFWVDDYVLELMKSMGSSHGSLSLLFMMKVTIQHYMSDSHEVMTSLIVHVTFDGSCGD